MTAGFVLKPAGGLPFVFDFQKIWYSKIDSVANPIANPFDCPALDGTDPESCLGGSRGAGFGWEDMEVYRFGVQYPISPSLELRTGASFAEHPIGRIQYTSTGCRRKPLYAGADPKAVRQSGNQFRLDVFPEGKAARPESIRSHPNDRNRNLPIRLGSRFFKRVLAWNGELIRAKAAVREWPMSSMERGLHYNGQAS